MDPEMPRKNPTMQPGDLSELQMLEWLGVTRAPENSGGQLKELTGPSAKAGGSFKEEKESSVSWRGKRSEVAIKFITRNSRSTIHQVTIHGLGPSGERLAKYESVLPPSDRISDALVKLLTSRPREVDIDLYLTDIGGLVRADKKNDLALVPPLPQPTKQEIYPMQAEAPSFLQFAKDPSLLANTFVAAWDKDSRRYEIRGVIEPTSSTARLVITALTEQETFISEDAFDIIPQRGKFSSLQERHNHLRTLIWEAIEVCRTEGPEAVACRFPRASEGLATWDDSQETTVVDSPAGVVEFTRRVNGEVVEICESVGGATIALELARTQAAISIVLPMHDRSTQVVLLFEPSPRGRCLSVSEVEILRKLTTDLASKDQSVRKRAREALFQKSADIQIHSQPMETLHPAFRLDSKLPVRMCFGQHKEEASYLIDWILEGYHPALFFHDYFSRDYKRGSHNFTKMVIGLSRNGDIQLELTHACEERCSAHIPVGRDCSLFLARKRARNIIDRFADHQNYSWDRVLDYIRELTTAEREGGLYYECSPNGRRLPPLSDRDGIIALENAIGVVFACDVGGRFASYDSFRMYTGDGEAMAFICYKDMPVALGVSCKGDKITALGCYQVAPGQSLGKSSAPLFSVQPQFRSTAPRTIFKAVGILFETFGELLQNAGNTSPKGTGWKPDVITNTFRKALTQHGSDKSAARRGLS